jgi:putative aminopeptidase FrvX
MDDEAVRASLVALLEELSEAFGVSGFEGEVRGKIRRLVEPLADEVEEDPVGNLHAVIDGGGSFVVMLDAHMDEVGFVIKGIEENGFLRLAPIGGWDVRVLPGQAILVRGRDGQGHWGVVGSVPPHVQEGKEKERVLGWNDLFADVGAKGASDVRKMGIRVGSPAVLHEPFRALGGGTVLGKALDDRAGCALLVALLESLARQRPACRVVATFSSAEEVGSRGARVAAQRWEPQMAFVLEGTLATDTPGVRPDQRVSSLGLGPVLTAVDRGLIVPERLLERIISVAESLCIPWQIKTPLVGSTDGGAIQQSGRGVVTAVLAVPCRYIHSPACMMRVEDLLHTLNLVEALVRQAERIYHETR